MSLHNAIHDVFELTLLRFLFVDYKATGSGSSSVLVIFDKRFPGKFDTFNWVSFFSQMIVCVRVSARSAELMCKFVSMYARVWVGG